MRGTGSAKSSVNHYKVGDNSHHVSMICVAQYNDLINQGFIL